MIPREVAGLLAFIADAWSITGLGVNSTEIWAESCATVDVDDARVAIRRLAKSEERPPSIARFLEECRLVRRNDAPMIGPGPEEQTVTRDEASRRIAAIRRGFKVATDMIPDHDHRANVATGKRAGWVDCPACSTAKQREPILKAAIRDELDAEGIA